MTYTNQDLLAQIKLDAFVPTSQYTFEDDDIFRVASTVIETELLPLILKTKGDYYLSFSSVTVDSNGYTRIPNRAVGNAIAEVRYPSGVQYDDQSVLTGVKMLGQKLYMPGLQGNQVDVFYYLRPGKLTSSYATITNIDVVTGIITAASLPTTFSSTLKYDFIRANGGYETLAIDVSSSVDLSLSQMTFSISDIPSDLTIGDYILIADQSPVPQIPVELFGYLSHLTAIKMLQSIGDFENASVLDKKTKDLKDNILSLISPRVMNHSKSIVRPF